MSLLGKGKYIWAALALGIARFRAGTYCTGFVPVTFASPAAEGSRGSRAMAVCVSSSLVLGQVGAQVLGESAVPSSEGMGLRGLGVVPVQVLLD